MKALVSSLILLLILCSAQLFGQSRVNGYKNKHKPIHVSSQKAKVICPIFEKSAYPFHGFGFKVGDPVALTYKLYFREKISFALDVGSASSGLYNSYHRSQFNNYSAEIAPPTDYPNNTEFTPQYARHVVNGEYVVEGKILYQMKADDLYKGLQTYIGLGWQHRTLGIEYTYYYEYPNSNNRDTGTYSKIKRSQGPEIVVGIEYAYFKIPVSAFLEIEIFNDLLNPNPWYRFQGGIGVRYVF